MLDSLVQDIYSVLKDGVDITDSKYLEIADRFSLAMGDVFLKALVKREPYTSHRLRASNIGKPCKRQIWYDVNMPENKEELLPHTLLKFTFGNILEELLIALAEAAGHTVTDRQEEHEVSGLKGHQDCRIDGVLVDVKSASTYSYKKFADNDLKPENDSFGYLDQLAFYRNGNEDCAFLVIDKQNGHICLSRPDPKHLETNMPHKVEKLKETVSQQEPPERHFQDEPEGKSGNRKLCTECSYCSHKHTCWVGLRGFAYSNKPVWLTYVAKEPKVPEITGNV